MTSHRVHAPRRQAAKALHLQRAVLLVQTSKLSIRKAAKACSVSKSTLQRKLQHPLPHHETNSSTRTALTANDENILKDAVQYYANNGTPLSREGFKDLVQFYVKNLPLTRQTKIPFRDGRLGDVYVRNFLNRHDKISLKRRTNLENQRAEAMSPHNLASHFARLSQAYKEYKIQHPDQIFNIDESGFSIRTATRARTRALFQSIGRSNSKELKWAANAQHVTIMPVVSADGNVWSPLVVMLGTRSKYRIRRDGTRETPSSYLPLNAMITYRDPAGVDSEIFYQWVQHFVEETKELRKRRRNIFLTLDGYGAHCSFMALQMLRQNNIIAVGLPAHTSHRTQVLDFSVFSPFKNRFRNLLNERVVFAKKEHRNDIYTLCEILNKSYMETVSYGNIVKGFEACGLWDPYRRDCNYRVIKQTDITNIDGYSCHRTTYASYVQLAEDFAKSRNMLRADGEVIQNGTLVTTAGALLTSDDVLNALRQRENERRAAELERTARAEAAEVRRKERERDAVRRKAEKAEAAREKERSILWLRDRPRRVRELHQSRSNRRAHARLRTAAKRSAT